MLASIAAFLVKQIHHVCAYPKPYQEEDEGYDGEEHTAVHDVQNARGTEVDGDGEHEATTHNQRKHHDSE